MKWNLRLAAANRGIWKASEMQRLLAERGLAISAGKMSGLWSGHPASIKLADLDVICAVLDCTVADILIAEPDTVAAPASADQQPPVAVGETPTGPRRVRPRRRDGRSLPPV
jgi:DNA-binding Xre family transcriptional regulator